MLDDELELLDDELELEELELDEELLGAGLDDARESVR